MLTMLVVLGLLAACETRTVEVTRVVVETVVDEGRTVEVTRVVVEEVEITRPSETVDNQEESPITMDGYSIIDIPNLDPQLAVDAVSRDYIENLFVQLTNFEVSSANIEAEAATEWEVSDDGLTWTFHLRTDIPWIYHNPVTGETTQAMRPLLDGEGQQIDEVPAFVNANDFAVSIRRLCDPNLEARYSAVISSIIAGCSDLRSTQDPGTLTPDDLEVVGVRAPDESTLVVELAFPASYFLSMTSMWALAATPAWVIVEHGDDWVEAGNIVTNGRYVLSEWVHGVRRTLDRNRLMPEDMRGAGNIDRIRVNMVPDVTSGYALWLDNSVDESSIPGDELAAHLEQFTDETLQVPDLAVFYFGFRHTKSPFDKVEVRRAFSAAFDRQTYTDDVRMGQGLPMKHFAPPGIFGAPPIDEVGVGFDPEYAREQLAAAGYPDCEGFPQVTFLGFSGRESLDWMEYALAQWEDHLGCSAERFNIEQRTLEDIFETISADTPDEDAAHIWTMGWAPDYADENNWVGDALWCENDLNLKRSCSEVDELIVRAREERDAEVRVNLYREIEQRLFGPEGEMPIAPVFLRIDYLARHAWLEGDISLFGGEQWYNWTIDWAAKRAARDG